MLASAPTIDLVDTDRTDLRFQEALAELFSGDGTIYLVSGYITYQGYRAIRDDLVAFLERSPDNRLVAIVGPTADQFSSRIATDLWSLDYGDRVRLLKQRRGLHAKLYFRDGPDPRAIIGSANITRVAFEYNTELNVALAWDRPDHPDVAPIRDWVEAQVAASTPVYRLDILPPMLLATSMLNWSNKARILPAQNLLLRAIPFVILMLVVAWTVRII